MDTVTLEKINEDIQDIKINLHKLLHIVEEDFELNESVKKELEEARKEPISTYVDHEKVVKEFLE